jgi:hypothetical protein
MILAQFPALITLGRRRDLSQDPRAIHLQRRSLGIFSAPGDRRHAAAPSASFGPDPVT